MFYYSLYFVCFGQQVSQCMGGGGQECQLSFCVLQLQNLELAGQESHLA